MLEFDNIPYTIKVSARARRANLRIQPGVGLVVTIPKRFPKRDVPAVIAEHEAWIRATLAEQEAKTPELYRQWPPQALELAAINETWRLHLGQASSRMDLTHHPITDVFLTVNPNNKPEVASAVADALKRRARQVFPDWVTRLASPHNLSVDKVSVRGQRTLWGSYSSSGTLSLNYKLLFLPERYLDYVILHELAHTKYLDHSPQFWQFLFGLDAEAEYLHNTMNEATSSVPPWLELA